MPLRLTAVRRFLMPLGLTALLLSGAVALAAPVAAGAHTPASKVLKFRIGSAMAMVQSNRTVPLHFSSSAGQAVRVAEQSPTLRALHARVHPLQVVPYVWRAAHPYWYVVFTYRGKIVADANVSPAGKLTGVWTGAQAWAPYTHGHIAAVLDSPWILVPFGLLFMLAFFDPRRLRRPLHFDALAVLAFLVSYQFLADGHLGPAVWLAYPPLIYLLARMLRLGFGRPGATGRLAPLLGMRTLVIGLCVMLVARIAISLLGQQEIDVGYESVIGAFRVLHHLPLYWPDPNHGDTYGPVAYLAYVPFQLLFPWGGSLSNLHAADAAAIVFDLGTVLGLIFLGRRLRSGADGTRLGLVMAWAWAACPFTVIGLIVHTNDGLIAMLSVFMLLALASPLISGTLLGLATAAKFSPAGLLPLLAAPRKRGLKGAVVCTAACAGVVAVAIFSWLPSGGLAYFWQRTIGFQINRVDVFSPWALHGSLHPVQLALEALAVVLAVAVAFVPRERPLPRLCALAAAVTIAVQLPATHWFYYYILWFLPFLLVAGLAHEQLKVRRRTAEEPEQQLMHIEDRRPEAAGTLVGV
ncbi:MAG: glycosyltransferase family 87 protein [Solirubrobacteraceae bacterium]